MGAFATKFAGRKPIASAVILGLLAAGTITVAAMHPGFAVTDPELHARDVWVTNGEELMAGRLNRQIEELDAAVNAASNEIDVFQDGDDGFLYDRSVGSIERIDAAFTTLTQRIDVPPASRVAYGGDVLAVLSPKGELWNVDAGAELSFSSAGQDPVAKLGEDARVAVSPKGVVFATYPAKGKLLTLEPEAQPKWSDLPKLGDHEIAAVGERAVVLDLEDAKLVVDGRELPLPAAGVRLQQSGAENDEAWVAGSAGLMAVPLNGDAVREVDAGADGGSDPSRVAAPVWVEGCAHGAWSETARYVAACDGNDPLGVDIEQPTAGQRLEFRVNRDVVVLNNLDNGNAWLVDSDMRLVENWEDVSPPEESETEEGDEKSSRQSFEDTLAERDEKNRPPVARDDVFGVRAERTTVLDLLANDTDPDGDVLTIASTSEIPEGVGRLEAIDGGRALQFTPAPGAAGTVSFRYGVDDGRGGVAEASVNVRVVPETENEAPTQLRHSVLAVEQGQQISTNVLTDWLDPDGDDLFLVNASPTSGDSVRFSPDGFVTFEHRSGELGTKEIKVVVSDGDATATGDLMVEVEAAGSLNPVGTPDYLETFAGETALISPLENDLSPSGAPLELVGVEDAPADVEVTPNLERGTIGFRADTPGDYLFLYELGAGASSSVGLIRVTVNEPPEDAPEPIAVKDTAYLRPNEPVVVPVLANDVSPSGQVLAVQGVDDTATDGLVSLEIITNTAVRITANQALDRQLRFTYTVSDGLQTAEATVTIVPVPPLVKNQPPVAVNDAVKVRAGDIVTVPVLENDYHPDSAKIHVAPELVETGEAGDGLAFVAGDTVRYQAPDVPGTYSVVYAAADESDQTATATLSFTVVGPDPENNRAPMPTPITSRVFAGSAVRIEVPLDGLDPDGDSVTLTGISSEPKLGRIAERTSTGFVYSAFDGSAGTDAFEYEVTDTGGKTATGTIRIGVIPRPELQLPPNAVDDTIEMKPGRTASVEVLLNDSDPSGFELHVADLPKTDEGIEAEIQDRRRVVVRSGDEEGAYTLRYTISNGHGGTDTAFIQVAVSEDAVVKPPTAEDQVIEPDEVAENPLVNVRPLDDATNPGGLIDDLKVTVEGPNEGKAELHEDGTIDVEAGSERYVVAYRLTNEIDDLSARAFIIVPPIPGSDDGEKPREEKTPEELQAEERAKFQAPHLANLGEVIVPMNGEKTWKLSDIVVVPSGQPPLMLSARATNAAEEPFVDDQTLKFVPEKDFRGRAQVSFDVTDGKSADDPIGRRAVLTIPIIVGDPEFRDTPPAFTPRTETIEAGEEPIEVDLRASSDHPNPEIIEQLKYTNLKGANEDIEATIDGGTLTVSSPLGVQPGTATTLEFDVGFGEFTVPGQVEVKVVSSTRALPKAVEDKAVEIRRGESGTSKVLANDFNPFEQDGEPLRVIDAKIAQSSVGSKATVSHTASAVTVKTTSSFTGNIAVTYRIQDATKDPAREVQGVANFVVRDAPARIAKPSVSPGDGKVTVSWKAPANNNAKITKYTVHYGGKTKVFDPSDGTSQTIGSLSNGTSYTFKVTATNKMGTSTASPGATTTPYGKPTAVRNLQLDVSGESPNGKIKATWQRPANLGGKSVKYVVTGPGGTKTITGTSTTFSGLSAGKKTVTVHAVNEGNLAGPKTSKTSAAVPKPSPVLTLTKGKAMGPYHGSWGTCNGTCWFYHVEVKNFKANTNYTVVPYCGSHQLNGRYTIRTNGSGNGSYSGDYNSAGNPESFCGGQGRVEVGGKSDSW